MNFSKEKSILSTYPNFTAKRVFLPNQLKVVRLVLDTLYRTVVTYDINLVFVNPVDRTTSKCFVKTKAITYRDVLYLYLHPTDTYFNTD